jgi:hypothetical protein
MGNGPPDDVQPGSRPGRPRSGRTRNLWLIAGIATLAAMALAGGVVFGSHLGTHRSAPPTAVLSPGTNGAPPPATSGPPAAATLAADFTQLETQLHAVAGIAVSAVGTGQAPIVLGDWQSGPAWSTIKVPLMIAALREENPPKVTDTMIAAITESDNAAAETIWASLGDPVTAAHKVEAVLREAGDPTTVQSQKVRPEFSASGQTDWALTDQVRFTSAAVCDSANAPIFALMGQVEPDQSWGIGTVPGTKFKGGWGPSPTGSYLVRQMGVLAAPNGMIAVALAAQPASGKFEDGTADLTEMANWLTARLGALPAGQCGP